MGFFAIGGECAQKQKRSGGSFPAQTGGAPGQKKAGLFAFALLFCAQPVFAERLSCAFETECMGADGCSETDFSIDVTLLDPTSEISTVFGDFHGATSRAAGFDTVHAHVPDTGDSYLLSVSENGQAYFSVHMPSSEMVLYYAGTCEASL